MDPIGGDDSCWDYLDYNYLNKIDSSDFIFFNEDPRCDYIDFSSGVGGGLSGNVGFDSFSGVGLNVEIGNECARKSGCSGNVDVSFAGGQSCSDGCGVCSSSDCARKRACYKVHLTVPKSLPSSWVRTEESSGRGSKAYREKMRRDKLNDRFSDLSSVLDPGRPVRNDKPALLDDTIRVVNHLRNETQELKETNEKLLEEIKSLKAEKSELREEKLVLKADKERMELQLKAMTVSPPGFMQTHPAAYPAGPNKMSVLPPGFMQPHPGYGMIPMWQYLAPATRDTSADHQLRPPAA